MSDHVEFVIKKNITSTELLYNVKPDYFDNIEFYKAIKERARLAKENSKRLYRLQEQCNDKDMCLKLESMLNDVYRAEEFNICLLNERFNKEK